MLDRLSGVALFAAVVEAGNLTAAAAALGMSRSAVSKALARLEDRLGARLVNRTTRHFSLTEAGRSFHAHCIRILVEADAAEEAVGRLQTGPRGRLRLNGPVSFGILHLAPLLPAFMRRYPELGVEAVFGDRYVDVVEEAFDVVVRIGRLADSTLMARKLCDERHVLCAAPSYWERRGRPERPADLAGHDCLTYAYLSTGDRWRFEGAGGVESVQVAGRLRSNNGEVLRAAAVAGEGVVLLPSFACWGDILEGRLEPVLKDYPPPPIGVYALWPQAPQVPAKVRLFVDFLAESLGSAPWQRTSGPSAGAAGR